MRVIKPEIIYEDADLLVCRKPAGVPVQTKSVREQDMVSILKNYRSMKKEEPYIGLVHRLDQPVEGIMVFAKNKKAAAALSAQIADGKAEKYYYAAVLGTFEKKQAVLEDYMLKDGQRNRSAVVPKETAGAKKAVLSYEVAGEKPEKSLLRIRLETGRHHQIRVQLANAGHPIIGDRKYGIATNAGSGEKQDGFAINAGSGEKQDGVAVEYSQMGLCSYHIAFLHPADRHRCVFELEPKGEAFQDF